MVGWDLFKSAYSSFLCNQNAKSAISAAGTLCLKSGINDPSFNFFIVDNLSNSFQKDVFLKTFDCNGFVASFQESRDFIKTWSPSLQFLGPSAIMSALPNNIINIDIDQNIDVKSARTESVVEDHISIVKEVRHVSGYEDLINKIKNNMHIYVAYINNVPVGTGSAIQVGKDIFILDTITRDKYQNSGVLSAIGQVSMQEAKVNGAEKISAMVTSAYSQKVAEHVGFKVEQVFDFWKNEVK